MSKHLLQEDDDTTLLLRHHDAKGLNAMESLRPEEKRDPTHHCRTAVMCGVCHQSMFWPESSNTARCPYCGRVNYISALRYLSCASCWFVAAFLVFAIAIGLVVGTASWSASHRGIIVAWTGLFAAGLVLLVRSCVYCCRPFYMTRGNLVTEV